MIMDVQVDIMITLHTPQEEALWELVEKVVQDLVTKEETITGTVNHQEEIHIEKIHSTAAHTMIIHEEDILLSYIVPEVVQRVLKD